MRGLFVLALVGTLYFVSSQEHKSPSHPNTNNDCQNEGFYPNRDDCSRFHRCVSLDGKGGRFQKHDFQCSPGTLFHAEQSTCVHAWQMPDEKLSCRSTSSSNQPASIVSGDGQSNTSTTTGSDDSDYVTSCGRPSFDNNVTVFTNPSFPQPDNGSMDCFIKVYKILNYPGLGVCQYRLDFLEFSLAQPEPHDHTCESDVFVVTGGRPLPSICGENSGQHMIIDLRDNTVDIKLRIITGGEAFPRRWRIKISQIYCNPNDEWDAPSDNCLQIHKGVRGRILSFNYGDPQKRGSGIGAQLNGQEYAICIRAEEEFCGIRYIPCKGSTEFSISGEPGSAAGTGETTCRSDWVGISCATDNGRNPQSTGAACVDRLCGSAFSSVQGDSRHHPVYSFTRPFIVFVHFNDLERYDTASRDTGNRGFCLDYVQQSCRSGVKLEDKEGSKEEKGGSET